jgi:putative acetyltransferase
MHVRPELPTDIHQIHAVNCAAFDSPMEANLVDALREQTDVISLVAEQDGHILGHILFSPVRLTGADDLRVMGLAPMAVALERQRTGIGSALVREGLAECQRQGVAAVFVVGHPGYYPRFGFCPASGFGITCEFEVPDEVFMAMGLVPGVLKGRAGRVFYHEAFRAAEP